MSFRNTYLKRAFLISIPLLLLTTQVHSQNWIWAKTASVLPGKNSITTSVAVDATGNVYACGYFDSKIIHFGSTTLNNDSTGLDTAGATDIFVVKYLANGGLVWAKSFGGALHDNAYGLCIDKWGYVYLAGTFSSAVLPFNGVHLVNQGQQDLFLAKLDPNGQTIWARSAGGTGDDAARSVCTDRQGNICITGSFDSPSLAFGSIFLTDTCPHTVPFVTKYDSSGTVLWSRTAAGTNSYNGNYGSAVCTDSASSIYITGGFSFASIQFGTYTLLNAGLTNLFVVKYDTSGNEVWAKQAGGINQDAGTGIGTDLRGNAYVCGSYFSPSITFGWDTLHNGGSGDIFLVKYDPNGNPIWSRRAGGSGTDEASGICIDPNGYAYLAGSFNSATLAFGSSLLSNQGNMNLFIAEFDYAGNPVWAESAGGSAYDYGTCAFADASGNAYLGGNFESSSVSFGTTPLFFSGTSNMYVAKVSGVTGIKYFSEIRNEVLCYPNPADVSTSFLIQNKHAGCCNFTLSTLEGKVVSKISGIYSTQFDIKRDGLPAGIYFYTIQNSDHQIIGRGKLVFE
jgi:hypothetical protein